MELVIAGFMVAWWTVGVIVLTRSGSVAAGGDAGNLYYSLWISFFFSVWIVSRWKFVSGEELPQFEGTGVGTAAMKTDTVDRNDETEAHVIGGDDEEKEKEKVEDV